jgi:hypothetical protein
VPKQVEALISELTDDLQPVRPPLRPVPTLLLWLGFSLAYVVTMTLWLGPFRDGVVMQLLEYPRFLLEMTAAAAAILCFGLSAFRQAVPGLSSKTLQRWGIGLSIGWVVSFLAGFIDPVFEPSMLGKREHCTLELYLLAGPPLVIARWLQHRVYILQPNNSMALAAVAAGMIPGALMQAACMYEPGHILLYHVAPVGVVVAAALAAAVLFARKSSGSNPR